jgi:hypothetical protein
LRTLGFVKSQLAAAITWQSTAAVAIGTSIEIPLGIVLGRSLWDLFATEIYAVPARSVPVASIVVIAVAAPALANIVAAVPGRVAARTPTALSLRAE